MSHGKKHLEALGFWALLLVFFFLNALLSIPASRSPNRLSTGPWHSSTVWLRASSSETVACLT